MSKTKTAVENLIEELQSVIRWGKGMEDLNILEQICVQLQEVASNKTENKTAFQTLNRIVYTISQKNK